MTFAPFEGRSTRFRSLTFEVRWGQLRSVHAPLLGLASTEQGASSSRSPPLASLCLALADYPIGGTGLGMSYSPP